MWVRKELHLYIKYERKRNPSFSTQVGRINKTLDEVLRHYSWFVNKTIVIWKQTTGLLDQKVIFVEILININQFLLNFSFFLQMCQFVVCKNQSEKWDELILFEYSNFIYFTNTVLAYCTFLFPFTLKREKSGKSFNVK